MFLNKPVYNFFSRKNYENAVLILNTFSEQLSDENAYDY